jgi:hypothetical protein
VGAQRASALVLALYSRNAKARKFQLALLASHIRKVQELLGHKAIGTETPTDTGAFERQVERVVVLH